jgi:hypothetical protein
MANNANDVLSVARGEIGYSRYTDPAAGTKYGRWFAQQTGQAWYGATGVPYCAMFVSWCLAQAGARCAGFPGAYCPSILNAARAAGRVVSSRNAQPGDVVLFQWDTGDVDHVGLVERNFGSYLQTIEGNVSGKVLRRTRSWGVVAAIVRPYYDSVTTQKPSTSTGTSSGKLAVDGYWGSGTTRRLQQFFGTPQDGVVSSQNAYWKNAGITAGLTTGWEWVSNPTGSTVMRAIQARIGAEADGILGPGTIKALEAHYGTEQDGRLDSPSLTVQKMQAALNRGQF